MNEFFFFLDPRAWCRLLKSGMSLTQIFSRYVAVSEKLLLQEEENKRLNNYVDQILQVWNTRNTR